MDWLSLLGIAIFSALCWEHGYTKARFDAWLEGCSARNRAYLQGRRDERAITAAEKKL